MDRLDDLPTNENSKPTPQELSLLQKYFDSTSASSQSGTKTGNISTFQLVLYATFIFMVLSNSWIDIILKAIPYMESPVALLLLKCIIFAAVFTLVYKFCM